MSIGCIGLVHLLKNGIEKLIPLFFRLMEIEKIFFIKNCDLCFMCFDFFREFLGLLVNSIELFIKPRKFFLENSNEFIMFVYNQFHQFISINFFSYFSHICTICAW